MTASSTATTLARQGKKKARGYSLKDLIADLEHGDFAVYKPLWLLKPFGWDGAKITIPQDSTSSPQYLLQEALSRNAFRAARRLVRDCQANIETINQALISICDKPPHLMPSRVKLSWVDFLLDHGASADYKDNKTGRTALHVCFDSHQNKMDDGDDDDDDMNLLSLLALHANVNTTDRNGNTVLHKTLLMMMTSTHRHGNKNADCLVRMLLYNGANPNLVDGQGRHPLVLASGLAHHACFQRLLQHPGTKIDLQDAHGRSVLALAENPATALLLLQLGLRSDTQDTQGVAPLHTEVGLWCRWQQQQEQQHRNKNDCAMPSHHFQYQPLIELLVAKTGNVNLRDKNGRTALHYASEVPHATVAATATTTTTTTATTLATLVQALVDRGADLEAVDANGWTPLHVAVAGGNFATAAQLVALGAPTRVRDPRGRSPLHVVGMDRRAWQEYPAECDRSLAVRQAAFGDEAAPSTSVAPPTRAPPSSSSSSSVDGVVIRNDGTNKNESDLVDLFLHRGFDFTSLDEAGNMPFFFASDNDTMHYQMVHAAACQGLLG